MGPNADRRTNLILAATDLSAHGDRAIARAAALARRCGAALAVVHAAGDESAATKAGNLIREQLADLPGTAEAAVRVRVGAADAMIVGVAGELGADLVVLGRHAGGGLVDLFRGSTAERVIRGVRGAVLLAQGPAAHAYDRVIVGIDFSAASRHALAVAVGLLPAAGLTLVHAGRPDDGGRDEAEGWSRREAEAEFKALAERFPAAGHVIRVGDTRSVLREAVHAHGADLLVIGTHGRAGLAHALLGSVAEDLLRDPPCDVLVAIQG